MTGKIYRPEDKHPDHYQGDLTPDASEGMNYGLAGPHPEKENACTAFDVKDVHRLLHDWPDNLLKQVTLQPPGSRLEQGATYVDLQDPSRREFTATGDMEASSGHWYVPKTEVPYQLWNRLIGVENPQRKGAAGTATK